MPAARLRKDKLSAIFQQIRAPEVTGADSRESKLRELSGYVVC